MTEALLLPGALGAAVGLVLGLTGAGGSILAVPLLMWGLGWSLPQAAPVALLAVFAASTFGTVAAWDATYVRYRVALLMAATGFVTAPLGLLAATRLPAATLVLLFAAVLALAALRMLRQTLKAPQETLVLRASVAGEGSRASGPICRLNTESGRILWTRPCALVITATGAVTGFLAGLLGVGGGFVIVPALRASTELSMHSAVATSLMAVALTAAGTVGAALLQGRDLPWLAATPFVAGALAGMLVGRKLGPRLAGPHLQQGFALLMLAAAAILAWPLAQS
jgi:uncharacterized membrane protein YfcA